MNFLLVQPNSIHLKGISRTTTFSIKNQNEFLAVSYSLEFKGQGECGFSQLSCFPTNGILMRGEQQKIKIKYNTNNNQSTLDEFVIDLAVKFTYKIEYNKHLMNKYNLKGWQAIPDQVSEKLVEVIVGGEKEAIENYIKEDIIFNNEFDNTHFNISQIQQSKNKSFINQKSFQELEIDSIIQSKSRIKQNSKPGKQNIEKNILYEDFQELVPLQYGASKISNSSKRKKTVISQNMHKYPFVQSRFISEQLNKTVNNSLKTVQNNDFSNDLTEQKSEVQNRNLQLLILAIIAAFFVALGNNLGRVIG